MRKFGVLLKKELGELLTIQTLLPLVIGVLIFMFLGNFMSDITSDMQDNYNKVSIVDQDRSDFSSKIIKGLEQANYDVTLIPSDKTQDVFSYLKQNGDDASYIVIPKGFEKSILVDKKPASVEVHALMKSTSAFSNMGAASASSTVTVINEIISNSILSAANPELDIIFAKNPVVSKEITHVGEKSAAVSTSELSGFLMSQTVFIPIILFMLIIYASQMTTTTIANEKTDKTLETLLSAPVPRLYVLASKMCAAGIISVLYAGVFMIGFSNYMGGMMGDMGDSSQISTALQALGLELGPVQFALIGIQLFLTILITLSISTILGALAEDIKSAQTVMAPLMIAVMLPYFVTIFTDVESLPIIGRLLLYLLPFTHAFTATSNLMMSNYLPFILGAVYQLIMLIICLSLAVHIFSSDKIFTMKISGRKRRMGKKAPVSE